MNTSTCFSTTKNCRSRVGCLPLASFSSFLVSKDHSKFYYCVSFLF